MAEDRKIGMAIAILKEFAEGRTLRLKSGHIIGMSEDGFIGFLIQGKISQFFEVTFSQLVDFCKKDNIILIPRTEVNHG